IMLHLYYVILTVLIIKKMVRLKHQVGYFLKKVIKNITNSFSLSVKVVFILYLLNNKGTSMIQTLIAFTIIIMLVMTITPSVVIIKKEQNVLKQRFKNMHLLHDILIKELNEEVSDNKISKDLNLKYTINHQEELGQDYGDGININNGQEFTCYYRKKYITRGGIYCDKRLNYLLSCISFVAFNVSFGS